MTSTAKTKPRPSPRPGSPDSSKTKTSPELHRKARSKDLKALFPDVDESEAEEEPELAVEPEEGLVAGDELN